MEWFVDSGINCFSSTVRRKRSNLYRQPRPNQHPFPDSCETSPLSTLLSSADASKISSSVSDGCAPGGSACKENHNDDGAYSGFDGFATIDGSRGSIQQSRSDSDFKRCTEGVLAPANRKNVNKIEECSESQSRNPKSHFDNQNNGESHSLGHSTGLISENKLRKVKLKVGGVTRTIHAKSTFGVTSGDGSSSLNSFCSSNSPGSQKKPIIQNTVDNAHSSSKKVSGLQGVPWKDFSGGSFTLRKEASPRTNTKMPEGSASGNHAVRKSMRAPKLRVLDKAPDESDEDEEIQYLEKLKHSKIIADYGNEFQDDEEECCKKQRKISSVLRSGRGDGEYNGVDYDSSKLGRCYKQSRSEMVCRDMEYVEEEEMVSESDSEARRKKQRKESVGSSMESKREMTLMTRQRALQSGKDVLTRTGASSIEFPNGLPSTPPRKQKGLLSEVEQQLRKAEATQRRRMQVEKAARESEAAAIRKILGQDSNSKKREDRAKRRRDEIAQEKSVNATILLSNSVRWVLGPTGTVVVFPKDMPLPSIFDSKPCSYPPPREICAGPSCTNAYRYRDSKSKLPLCSLQCYRAIHEQTQPVSTC